MRVYRQPGALPYLARVVSQALVMLLLPLACLVFTALPTAAQGRGDQPVDVTVPLEIRNANPEFRTLAIRVVLVGSESEGSPVLFEGVAGFAMPESGELVETRTFRIWVPRRVLRETARCRLQLGRVAVGSDWSEIPPDLVQSIDPPVEFPWSWQP